LGQRRRKKYTRRKEGRNVKGAKVDHKVAPYGSSAVALVYPSAYKLDDNFDKFDPKRAKKGVGSSLHPPAIGSVLREIQYKLFRRLR
jgi:hypothetical protein